MPALANELTDTVIDFLHGDRSSLCACALVSKSCLPSARYHLFSDIVVNAFNFPSFHSLIESTLTLRHWCRVSQSAAGIPLANHRTIVT